MTNDQFTRCFMAHIRSLELTNSESMSLYRQAENQWSKIHYKVRDEEKAHNILRTLIEPYRKRKEFRDDFSNILGD